MIIIITITVIIIFLLLLVRIPSCCSAGKMPAAPVLGGAEPVTGAAEGDVAAAEKALEGTAAPGATAATTAGATPSASACERKSRQNGAVRLSLYTVLSGLLYCGQKRLSTSIPSENQEIANAMSNAVEFAYQSAKQHTIGFLCIDVHIYQIDCCTYFL